MKYNKNKIIKETNEFYNKYLTKLTLRQVFYHLGSAGVIPLTNNAYKALSRVLVKARHEGHVPFEVFEDKLRTHENHAEIEYYSPKISRTTDLEEVVRDELKWHISRIEDAANEYSLPRNLYQEHVVIVMLEKAALEGFVQPIVEKNGGILVVSRGFNSLTQIKEIYDDLCKETRKIVVLQLSDYDPSGIAIANNFVNQLTAFGVKFHEIRRIGLTREQIDKYSLPFAPTKARDSRAVNWEDGDGVVELDALEPSKLMKIVEDSMNDYFDHDIFHNVTRLERVLKRKLARRAREMIEFMKSNYRELYEIARTD